MERGDAEEYTEALGQVVAGGWRQVALGERLGVPKALGLTTREWVEDRLGGYVRLAIPERREAVAELTEEGMSTREIGDVLGVGKGTVDRDQKATAPNGAQPQADPARGDRPEPDDAPNGAPDPVDDAAIEDSDPLDGERHKRLVVWAGKVRDALGVLGRMAGYPVPDGLAELLDDDERAALDAVLRALEPEGVTT